MMGLVFFKSVENQFLEICVVFSENYSYLRVCNYCSDLQYYVSRDLKKQAH